MEILGQRIKTAIRIYFTGGATAVLIGWRETTIDVDIKLEPDTTEIFEMLAVLKDELDMNIELASPEDFIPPLPGWRDRSLFIESHGRLQFFHYDFHAQALSKIERGHSQDRTDVQEMLQRGLTGREDLLRFFKAIRSDLIRFPAIDPETFEAKVLETLQ